MSSWTLKINLKALYLDQHITATHFIVYWLYCEAFSRIRAIKMVMLCKNKIALKIPDQVCANYYIYTKFLQNLPTKLFCK